MILKLYITLMPTILAGIFNMIWCKLPILKSLKYPIDFNKTLKGKRIFGDNKTWKGLLGYVLLNIVFTILWGYICNPSLNHLNYFYLTHTNTLIYNLLVGTLLGLGYSLFELPNSFIKRRLNISEGKPPKGFKKIFFIFLDQADSVFGVGLVVWLFYDIGIKIYLLLVLVGALTHILLNMLLYFLHLRKNMF